MAHFNRKEALPWIVKRYFIIYLITLVVFLAVDAVWLGFVAAGSLPDYLSGFISGTANLLAAGLFYLLYPVGVVHFAVREALLQRSPLKAFISGALFGLFAYATYDLTNWATLPGWPAVIVAVDIAWGTILTGCTAAIAAWLGLRWVYKE